MREKEEGVIRFEEISASIMEAVLGFIYTGNVEIDDERNAKNLIIAADYLLLVCLKTVAGRFLQDELRISNCLSTFYFAEKYRSEDLVASSRKFILENFASVAESDEFLNLESEQVGSWISRDEICVGAEEDVLEIIERWIKRNVSDRKATFEELFCHVRLVFLSRDSLLDVVTNELVSEKSSCLRKVSEAIVLLTSASEDDIMHSPRRRVETHAIVACGGQYTLCYLPEKDDWKHLANKLSESTESVQMFKVRDQLYTFEQGGTVERYDSVYNGWASLKSLTLSSYWKRVAVVRGNIYAIDVNSNTSKFTVERYNVGSWSWESIFISHERCREDSCVVPAGNCIYVLGGKPVAVQQTSQRGLDRHMPIFEVTVKSVTNADRFDTVENKWERIADMQEARGDAFGVATQGKIFVAGGWTRSYGRSETQTCELYSISTNEWQFIGSLNVPRCSGSMVCVNGTLYVLGGKRSSSSEYSVESYDPTVNEWRQTTTIPVERILGKKKPSFKGCTLKLPRVVLDKPSISQA